MKTLELQNGFKIDYLTKLETAINKKDNEFLNFIGFNNAIRAIPKTAHFLNDYTELIKIIFILVTKDLPHSYLIENHVSYILIKRISQPKADLIQITKMNTQVFYNN